MPAFVSYRLHAQALLVLGLPLIGSHLAQILIGVTDALMLGWYDVAALAAVTLAHSVYFVIFIVGSGFAFAVLPMVASALAEGDETQVRREGDELRLAFFRRTDGSFDYEVERSGGLEDWNTSGLNPVRRASARAG